MIQQNLCAVAIAACTTLSMAACAGPSEPVDSDDPTPAASEGPAADTAPAAEAEAMPDGPPAGRVEAPGFWPSSFRISRASVRTRSSVKSWSSKA